jgi:phage-related protein
MAWPVVYYRDDDGREPVNDFIDRLEEHIQPVIDHQIERLGLFGPDLPFPHSSQVRGELRELRCHYGARLYRILYRRSANLFVLLTMFRKTGGDVPEAEVALANERWRDFKERMDAEPRIPPRAAGHDAP